MLTIANMLAYLDISHVLGVKGTQALCIKIGAEQFFAGYRSDVD